MHLQRLTRNDQGPTIRNLEFLYESYTNISEQSNRRTPADRTLLFFARP